MQGTRKNMVTLGVRLWTGRLGSVLLVTYLLALVAAPPALAAQSTVLHRAVKTGDLDGVTRLLASGADVDARDNRGRTALMYAVDKGYVLLVEPLLAAQADPNVRAPDGATALYIAVAHGHSEIITMLMKAGADPTIKGPKGRTAAKVAQMRYGDLKTAMKKSEPPAVIALLAGKTLKEGEELEELARTIPGTTFRDCEQCPEMVVVPAGRFRIGDLSGEGVSAEQPVHEVTIDYPFVVGKYEVRFAEWDACVAAGGCTHRPDDEDWGHGTRPVINVSWNDVQAYVHWLSHETGKPYRLLSEAEWEYVARAASTTKYHWGNDIGTNKANCGNCGSQWDNESTAPVGSFAPNAFGLFDMAGNVWEWVEDCYDDSYEEAPSDGSAWTSGNCDLRVLRGGSWYVYPSGLRSANRVRNDTGIRINHYGFRVARTLTP